MRYYYPDEEDDNVVYSGSVGNPCNSSSCEDTRRDTNEDEEEGD